AATACLTGIGRSTPRPPQLAAFPPSAERVAFRHVGALGAAGHAPTVDQRRAGFGGPGGHGVAGCTTATHRRRSPGSARVKRVSLRWGPDVAPIWTWRDRADFRAGPGQSGGWRMGPEASGGRVSAPHVPDGRHAGSPRAVSGKYCPQPHARLDAVAVPGNDPDK